MSSLTASDRAHIGVRRLERRRDEFTADDVREFARGDVSRGTVYKVLDALVEAGELRAEHRGNRKVWLSI